MLPRFLRAVLAALLLAAGAAQAQTIDVSGVKYPDSLDLRGTRVVLNGAGVRYKAVFKVYAAGLYLPRKAGSPEEVLAQTGPRRISITMLRDIDAAELGKLFSRGMEDNMDKSQFSKLVPGVLRMGQIFADYKQLKAGDTFTVDWVPGTGAILTIRGQALPEPFKEPEFYNALLRIWLGPNPADIRLKDALLGRPAA